MKKKCFVITPIDRDNSDVRRATDGLIDSVIEPVLEQHKILTFVSHRISEIGSISNQIITHLLSDDIVIANLTGLNPNVMYELAVRHASAKPVIILAEAGTKLPFDVATERVIFYINDMKGVEDLKSQLSNVIKLVIDETKNEDNPIYRVVKGELIRKDIEKNTPLEYILQELQEVKRQIKTVNNSNYVSFLNNNKKNNNSSSIFVSLDDNDVWKPGVVVEDTETIKFNK